MLFSRKPRKIIIEKFTPANTLTPIGWRTPKYLSGVFVVGVQHKPFGQRQFPFVHVVVDELRLAVVDHRGFAVEKSDQNWSTSETNIARKESVGQTE